MKTIEERVDEYTREHMYQGGYDIEDVRSAYITTLCREYCIAFYKAGGARNYHWHENNGALDDDMIIGWRDIHE